MNIQLVNVCVDVLTGQHAKSIAQVLQHVSSSKRAPSCLVLKEPFKTLQTQKTKKRPFALNLGRLTS